MKEEALDHTVWRTGFGRGYGPVNKTESVMKKIYTPPSRAQQPPGGQSLLTVEAARSHSDTPHLVGLLRTGDKASSSPLRDKTQFSQETEIHELFGIRTRSPSMQAAADPLFRPHDHRGSVRMKIFVNRLCVVTPSFM